MKLLRCLSLYGLLSVSLTACPFLEPPAPLSPLVQPKTQKEAYKSKICRPKKLLGNIELTYAEDGKAVSRKDASKTQLYEYDTNGFLSKTTETFAGYSLLREYISKYDNQGKLSYMSSVSNGILEFEWFYENGKPTSCYRYVDGIRGSNVCIVDDQGRLTKEDNTLYEYQTDGSLRSMTFALDNMKFLMEYDDKINPESLIPVFKGHPPGYHVMWQQAHNIKTVQVILNGQALPVETYEYTYKGQLPISSKVISNGTVVNSYSYEYEGCF